MMCRPFGKIGAQAAYILVVAGVARKRWRKRLVRGVVRMQGTIRLDGARLDQLRGEIAQLLKLGSLQPPHLLFERADAGDLANAGGNTEWKQVTGNVESARGEIA